MKRLERIFDLMGRKVVENDQFKGPRMLFLGVENVDFEILLESCPEVFKTRRFEGIICLAPVGKWVKVTIFRKSSPKKIF